MQKLRDLHAMAYRASSGAHRWCSGALEAMAWWGEERGGGEDVGEALIVVGGPWGWPEFGWRRPVHVLFATVVLQRTVDDEEQWN